MYIYIYNIYITTDLVAFTKEIIGRKLKVLCSVTRF